MYVYMYNNTYIYNIIISIYLLYIFIHLHLVYVSTCAYLCTGVSPCKHPTTCHHKVMHTGLSYKFNMIENVCMCMSNYDKDVCS